MSAETSPMKEDLEAVERFIAEELEQRQSGGEDCPRCHGEGSAWIGVDGDPGGYYDYLITCPICKGEGRSPTITSAESALAALRRVRVRVERIRQWAESHADDSDPPEMSSRAEAELMLVFLNDPES